MKKRVICILLLFLPFVTFSESIFTFYMGTDIQKVSNIDALDNLFKNMVGGRYSQDSNQVPYPNSKILIPMLSLGIDMQFVSQKNGFTFFWNNAFLYADHVVGYEALGFTYTDKLNAENIKKRDTFKIKKFYVYSTEMLFGGTFRRENAFNIYFGVGFKTQFNPSMIWDIIGIVQRIIPNSVQMYAMLAGFGGTFGFSYYFNNVVGLTFSINDFVGLGAAVVARFDGFENDGYPRSGKAMFSLGINNNFAMKFGLSLRVNGTRGDSL
ncbi:MAG: DUF2715 domain-containing protein [Treponema sp.]